MLESIQPLAAPSAPLTSLVDGETMCRKSAENSAWFVREDS